MLAVYVNPNQFTVSGPFTSEFSAGRRVRADCGTDGYIYGTVTTSSYSSPNTAVTISGGVLTSNLTDVLYGIINIGTEGSFPNHTHDSSEGQGGQLDFTDLLNNNISFLYLTDTPTTYSGFEDKYLKVTSSGISFVDIEESSAVTTLIDLTDTPSSYDGGKYLRSTTSGTEWAEVSSSSIESFLDLSDTPEVYVTNKYLKTTTSGLEFVDIVTYSGTDGVDGTGIYSGTDAPPEVSFGIVDDLYLNINTYELYKKNNFTYGSNICLGAGGTATAASTHPAYDPANLFNGSGATWASDYDHPSWVQYTFLEPKNVRKVIVYPTSTDPERHPGSITILGSTTGAFTGEEVTLGTFTGLLWVVSTPQTFFIEDNAASYLSYRFFLTEGSNDYIILLAEIEMYSFDTFDWQSVGNIKGADGADGNDAPTTFSGLSDTPNSYDDGKYLQATTSGLVWTTIEETDLIFLASPASEITSSGIENWNTAFSWGDHADSGYLTEVPTQSGTGAATFLELSDTPTTYTYTQGMFLVSTGSGIAWATVSGSDSVFFGSGYPAISASINNVYFDTSSGDIYRKVRESGSILDGDVCVGGTATTNSVYQDNPSSYGAPRAFDDSLGTLWHSANTTYPIYIQYQFTEAQIIGRLRMYPLSSFPTRMPRDFTLKASNTGAFAGEETDVVSYSGQTYSVGQWKEFTFSPVGAFLYYRIHITGSSVSYQNIPEIEMMAVDVSGWEKQIDPVNNFTDLLDTPNSYDDGKYLQATTSGIEFVNFQKNFLDLTDTPTTYSGSAGKYLITTTSGISYSNQLYKGKQTVKVEYKDGSEVYINPGIVDVDGVLQEVNTRTTISGSPYLTGTWYFVYVNQSGSLTVSSGIPTLDYNKIGYYNNGDKCIGLFMTDSSSDIRRFGIYGQEYVFEEASVADYIDRPWGNYTTAETVTLTSVPLNDSLYINFSGEADVSTGQGVIELSTTDSVNVKRFTKGENYIFGRCGMRCFNKQVVVTCTNVSAFYLAIDGFTLPSYIYTGA